MALPNFFRMDQWVKTTQGLAVSGAQVYVVSQPVSDILDNPPAPLATLYTDSTGQTTVPQPLITDSFGHVSAYMAPNLYTVVIYNNGQRQQVYADQAVAAAGIINSAALVAGTGISIVGNVISGAYTAGAGITIVNGVISATGGGGGGVSSLNSLTGALSITAGSGITVTPSGSNIQIAASGGGGGGVSTATVTLSSSQLVNLRSTPVTIVAGQVGKTIFPLMMQLAYNFNTVPYSGASGNIFQLFPNNQINFQWDNGVAATGLVDQSSNQLGFSSVNTQSGSNAPVQTPSNYQGADLRIGFGQAQGAAPLSAGNGTVTVTVSYLVI